MNTPVSAIQTAARLSGLTPFVIRAWEKRHGVVHPQRTESNQRRYSDADVERLSLLRRLTEMGKSISEIAALADPELRDLLRKLQDMEDQDEGGARDYAAWRGELMRHAQQLDAARLEGALIDAERAFPRPAYIGHVIAPFIADIGNGWREGRLRIVQEHLASSVLRRVLLSFLTRDTHAEHAARVVSATPSGQVHELGVLLAALAASSAGHAVTHLGADLPAEEIALAARALDANVVLLSIVYPPGDAQTFAELVELVRLLPADARLLVGGASAPAYLARLDDPSVFSVLDLSELHAILSQVQPRG